MKYQVVWLIGTMSGRGKPLDADIAQAWANAQNEIYGRGTHWVEPVPASEREGQRGGPNEDQRH